MLDTSRVYGDSERRLGHFFSSYKTGEEYVATKLCPLSGISASASGQVISNAVEASTYESCQRLSVIRLDGVLLHRWEHYTSHKGRIWKTLLKLKESSVISELGASLGGSRGGSGSREGA
jgi:aryl-alcohol dehydrogenase-like predicted oxidoreductase